MFAVSVLATLYSVFPMLPLVMQDEYVYRRQVLLLEPRDYEYPNYFFSGLATLAELAQVDFYLLIKLLNALVASLAVATIYFVFKNLFGRSYAIVGAGAFLTVPAFFQASFYMPDMFLSAFLASCLALLLFATDRNLPLKSGSWILATLFLTLALLSKPHALIFVGGLFVFGLISTSTVRKVANVLVVTVGAVSARLAIGFLVAGPAGLNLLGSSYSGSLFGAPERALEQSSMAAGDAVSGVAGNPFVSFSWEALQLFGALSFATLGLLVVVLLSARRSSGSLLLTVITITGIVAIAGFETFVGITGDDHSGRILTRHLEYLVAFILVLAMHQLLTTSQKTFVQRWPTVLLSLGSATLGIALLAGLPSHRVSDGTIVILSGSWGGGYFLVGGLVAAIFWLTRYSATKWLPAMVVTAFLLVNVANHNEIRTAYSGRTPVDDFGQAVAKELDLTGRAVHVVGNSKAGTELFLFYTIPLRPSTTYFEPGSSIDMAAVEEPNAVLFPIEQISLITSCASKEIGAFTYFDCSNLRP